MEKEGCMYQDFARVYDTFMEDVPYDLWCEDITKTLKAHGISDGLVCELGCGTGNLTMRLAAAGYDMIGIDLSAELLAAAEEKQRASCEDGEETENPELRQEAAAAGRKNECADPESGAAPDILYLQQDMREFELYGTVRAIVCVCDSLNYILEEEEILKVFRLVRNYLDPGGLFVFDFHTPSFYAGIGEETIAENRPEGSFIWENSYDQETQLNRYDLTLFLPEENGFYSKSEETHLERGYTEETMRKLLAESGLICEEIRSALGEESGRLFAAASVPFLKQ